MEFSLCCYQVRTFFVCLFGQQCCSNVCGHTNLQVPVNDSINVAVMDTLQDLLYAVAEGGKVEEWDGSN